MVQFLSAVDDYFHNKLSLQFITDLFPITVILKAAFHFWRFCSPTKAPYCFLFALFADLEENNRALWSANKTIEVERGL